MNTPVQVDRDNVNRYVGIRGITQARLDAAVAFVENQTPEVIAVRLAEMGAEADRDAARLRLINIVTTNADWMGTATQDSVEWAFGRPLAQGRKGEA